MILIWEKYKKRIILVLILATLVVPCIIHILFKLHPANPFFSAEWTAGDLLGFYGVLLGACATVVGVYLTVRHTQENYREDVRNRSIPFLVITPLHNREDEQQTNSIFFIIKNGVVSIEKELSNAQQKHIEDNGFVRVKLAEGAYATCSLKMLYLPLRVENVGNGAAVTFSIGLNPKETAPDKRRFILPFSLSKGEYYYFAIYSENEDNANFGEYTLCLSYYDILGNAYEQSFNYFIREDDNRRVTGGLSLDGTQKRVEKELI